jgi:hypothetical protein
LVYLVPFVVDVDCSHYCALLVLGGSCHAPELMRIVLLR